jgi:sugar lactone lactonase YvrE
MLTRHTTSVVLALLLALLLARSAAAGWAAPAVTQVADFGWGNQPTGVAVAPGKTTQDQRVFVCFPRWFANHSAPTAAEVHVDKATGKTTLSPYPSAAWNAWTPNSTAAETRAQLVNVQSVFTDHLGRLWVLDTGSAFLGNVTNDGGPKLLRVDLETDAVVRVYNLSDLTLPTSYLNDVRISVDGKHAFLTDSNMGGLRHLDLETGRGRVLLAEHPSTHSEVGFVTSVEGKSMIMITGAPAAFQSDGIAVIEDYVYYHACTGRTLYRIQQDFLIDPAYTVAQVEAAVEVVSVSGVPDGMLLVGNDKLEGTLFMTAVQKDGIDLMFPGSGGDNAVLPFVSDQILQWPDSLSAPVVTGPDEEYFLYVTASQVDKAPFIQGARARRNTYGLYKVALPEALVRETLKQRLLPARKN